MDKKIFKYTLYFKDADLMYSPKVIYAETWHPGTLNHTKVIVFERDGVDFAWFAMDCIRGIQRNVLNEQEKRAIENGRLEEV